MVEFIRVTVARKNNIRVMKTLKLGLLLENLKDYENETSTLDPNEL